MWTAGCAGALLGLGLSQCRLRPISTFDAARAAGAETFDLAAAMEPVANGPEGGSYFFDSIHPTPKGAEKFSELLKPVLREVLDRLR